LLKDRGLTAEAVVADFVFNNIQPLKDRVYPVSEGKPNANYVRARIRTHVHSDYINEHHRTVLE
jgi:hypothetical protein